MKKLGLISLAATLGFLLVGAMPNLEKKGDEQKKRQQVAELLQDSTTRSLLIEQIANDRELSRTMLLQMLDASKADPARLQELSEVLLQDPQMRSAITKTLESGMEKPEARKPAKDAPEVLVKFKPDADEAQIKSLATEIGLVQVKEIKPLRLRVFKIASEKSVDEVISRCQKEAFVEYAEPNQKLKTQAK